MGLPKEYCHYMFCQYKFWGENDATIIPPLLQQDKLPDGVQRFNHTKVWREETERGNGGIWEERGVMGSDRELREGLGRVVETRFYKCAAVLVSPRNLLTFEL